MMDTTTAELLSQSLRRAFRGDGPDAVEAALDDIGWREALRAEGTAVAALLFAEQGAANAVSGAIDDVLAVAVGMPCDADTAVVLPMFGRHEAPGRAAPAGVAVRGIGSSRMLKADQAVVVVADDGGHRVAVIPTRHLDIRPVVGVDPRLGMVTVEAEGIATAKGSDTAEWPELGAAWPHAVAVGQVALAHELNGASRTMLRLAREHALTRIQFGRPIGSFQAVRHRLAESLVAIESAEAAAAAALESAGPALPAPVSPLLAGIAKALAGRGGRTVARHCQQVLAGVGFTAEHHFHRYFRRVLTLDGLLGDAVR